jgi:hypothetical protein
MKNISQLEQVIRDKVNNCRLYDRLFKDIPDEWYALCVAMDILADTCLALEDYESSGFGKCLDEQYLRMYGFFQAIFLQQDSIRQLYSTFMHSQLQPDENSDWQQLRELRNLTVGHPIEKKAKGDTERCFISRAMICNDSLQLLVWVKSMNDNKI